MTDKKVVTVAMEQDYVAGCVGVSPPDDDFFHLITHNAPLNTPHPGGYGIIWTLLDFYLKRGSGPEWPVPKGHNFQLHDGDLIICRPRSDR